MHYTEGRDLRDSERIEMLEKALVKYVELYGFIDEARAYYICHALNEGVPSDRKH